ncbi:MAG: hypothetical protein KBB83_05525 [Alphaproteobacteria bacterium]|nr:hypothetical protein [Alphaproteobacteria bacterium]
MQIRLFIIMTAFVTTLLPGCMKPEPEHVDMVILHLGSGATPSIARRLEDYGISYKILDGLVPTQEITRLQPKALILTGSPDSVLEAGSPRAPEGYYHLNIPVLGLCYGMQMMVEHLGGRVEKCRCSEKSVVRAKFTGLCDLTPEGVKEMDVLMDHDDCVVKIPKGFIADASTDITPHAMICSPQRKLYLIQFHPERADAAPFSGCILDAFLKKAMGTLPRI